MAQHRIPWKANKDNPGTALHNGRCSVGIDHMKVGDVRSNSGYYPPQSGRNRQIHDQFLPTTTHAIVREQYSRRRYQSSQFRVSSERVSGIHLPSSVGSFHRSKLSSRSSPPDSQQHRHSHVFVLDRRAELGKASLAPQSWLVRLFDTCVQSYSTLQKN